jgi:transcriptional regulator
MSVVKVKKEEYQKIVDLYKQGMSQPEIANIYDCSASTVSAILKTMNVETRLGGSKNTKQEVLKMCEMYKSGKLLQEVANEFNTTSATVSRLIKKNGVEIDRFKYHFNEHYFDKIDSQDKAYILGLLWADGHNRVDRGGVILELQEDDKELLEQINNITENERPLRKVALNDKKSSWKNQYNLLWQSKYLSSVLNKYGMCQRKSLVLEFPKWLDKDLYSHFIRGYMDGDGCVCYMQHKHKLQVSMVGTRVFLEVIQKICENIGVKSYITNDKRANKAICQFAIVSNIGSTTFLDWIYKNANLKMERKYNKYQQFLRSINNSCCV